jgi:serine protease
LKLNLSRRARGAAIAGACAATCLSFTNIAAAVPGGPLVNHGGPTQAAPKIYLDFWGPQWSTGWTDVAVDTSNGSLTPTVTTYTSAQAMAYITGFFKNAGPGGYFNSQLQYTSGVAPVLAGTWVDSGSIPPPVLLVPDESVVTIGGGPLPAGLNDPGNLLANEAVNAQSHFLGAGNDPNANFVILLPKATQTILVASACAYHSETVDPQSRKVVYTDLPYIMDKSVAVNDGIISTQDGCPQNFVNANNNAWGNGFMDPYSIVAGHEEAEVMTDPFPFTAEAWRAAAGGETGDICNWIAPGSDGGAHNIGPLADGHIYAVQTLYSNSAGDCV